MAEHPILFSAPMVRAILAGTKTQTRRVITPQPSRDWECIGWWERTSPVFTPGLRLLNPDGQEEWIFGDDIRCPFGVPGDRLWVRETWAAISEPHQPGGGHALYRADAGEAEAVLDRVRGWRPSIHMPRWASRITLEITDVRVERLTSISDEDARAEGITSRGPRLWRADWSGLGTPSVYATGGRPGAPAPLTEEDLALSTPRHAFGHLWDSINGNRPGCSWADNPWVWVVSFRRVEVAHG